MNLEPQVLDSADEYVDKTIDRLLGWTGAAIVTISPMFVTSSVEVTATGEIIGLGLLTVQQFWTLPDRPKPMWNLVVLNIVGILTWSYALL